MGEGRVDPWVSCQLMAEPYMGIYRFAILLKGTLSVL